MFFSISKTPDYSFPNTKKLGNYFVSFDHGWIIEDYKIYKGYISDNIVNGDIKQNKEESGNFCIIDYNKNEISIHTGKKQKFPLYIDYDLLQVSNLYKHGNEFQGQLIIKNDKILSYPVKELKFENLELDDDEIIDNVDKKLEDTILKIANISPFKLYLSGGVDTAIIASYVLKHKIPYEFVLGEHADMDYFLCHHRGTLLNNFWAYQTVQHWKEPSLLLTGSHGDETLLRDPIQAYLYLKYHNEDLVETCKNNLHLYQSNHCLKDSCIQSYEKYEDRNFSTLNELKSEILNITYNDFQHWHLGNTLFISPFDDIDLLKLMLNLSHTAIRNQLLDATISKEIIKRNRPGLLKTVSNQKNIDYYRFLCNLFEGTERLEDL